MAELAALVVLSSYLPRFLAPLMSATARPRPLPIFWGHGADDPLIPAAVGRASARAVSATYTEYPNTAHSASAAEVADAAAFICRISAAAPAASHPATSPKA